MKIDLLVPTRNRVKRLYNFLNSIKNTAYDKQNIAIYFYVDNDDEGTINNIENIKRDFNDLQIIFKIGPRIVLSNCWNALWNISQNEIIMHSGDDILFISKNWDQKVIEEFNKINDKLILVYGPDGIQNEKLGTHSFISRKATKILGYFVPPYFPWGHNDTWLNIIYSILQRRKYFPEIIIEHQHFIKYPQFMDEVYLYKEKQYALSGIKWAETRPKRLADAKKLLQFIDISPISKLKIKSIIYLKQVESFVITIISLFKLKLDIIILNTLKRTLKVSKIFKNNSEFPLKKPLDYMVLKFNKAI